MLEPSNTYHIYNHANGPENLFIEKKNYPFFLKQYEKYIAPIADTYGWCLMPNHFHLIISIKSEEELFLIFSKDRQGFQNLDGLDTENKNNTIKKWISQQFSNFFNSYTKAFNKTYNRRGALFLKNFRRKIISSDKQFSDTLIYIHLNPVKHGFTNQPGDWEFCSYNEYFHEEPNKILNTESVINRFSSLKEFKFFHESKRMQILKMNELD